MGLQKAPKTIKGTEEKKKKSTIEQK